MTTTQTLDRRTAYAPRPEPDAQTIALAQMGNEAAFTAIFNHFQAPIYNYIRRMMNDAQDAHDLTADVFLKAWLGLPKTAPDLKLQAWLFRIASNLCRDEWRHRKVLKWLPWQSFIEVFHISQVVPDVAPVAAERKELSVEVRAVLDRLKLRHRTCLVLREFQRLTYTEMAETMGITRSAIKSLLFRSRQEYRICWLQEYDDAH